MKLVVYGDKRGDARAWIRYELQFLVVERFRVRARPLCDHTERANVDWNRSLIVLHEFAKIEQHGDNLGWNRRAPQRGFQRSNENFAVTLVQLRPTRDKRGTEQISGETRLNLREFTARSKGRERRALQQVESESTHPLEPILGYSPKPDGWRVGSQRDVSRFPVSFA